MHKADTPSDPFIGHFPEQMMYTKLIHLHLETAPSILSVMSIPAVRSSYEKNPIINHLSSDQFTADVWFHLLLLLPTTKFHQPTEIIYQLPSTMNHHLWIANHLNSAIWSPNTSLLASNGWMFDRWINQSKSNFCSFLLYCTVSDVGNTRYHRLKPFNLSCSPWRLRSS